MTQFSIKVNGEQRHVDADDDTPLLWILRDSLHLRGTKYGCGIAQCGACTVLFNKTAVRSCSLPVSAIGDAEITSIEGAKSIIHETLKRAWVGEDVSQCGYCQAGQIMNASALLNRNKNPTDQEIIDHMHGNICRCGTYNRIKSAIKRAKDEL
jgi:aerobic-type carbon monoxide dehydrogenase small subunit (CoxS/CutS family)